jgi:hypothetical protein
MLLILTNSKDVTADYLVSELTEYRVAFLRFDTDLSLHGTRFSYREGMPILRIDATSYQPESEKRGRSALIVLRGAWLNRKDTHRDAIKSGRAVGGNRLRSVCRPLTVLLP